MSGKNIRFHMSIPYEQTIAMLEKHRGKQDDAIGIHVSNLETAPHRSSAALSWHVRGMVRTEGKVILIPEDELNTIVQIELAVKTYRNYLRRNFFTAIIFFVSLVFINRNLPIWFDLFITFVALSMILIGYEVFVQSQKRSALNNIDNYLASVTLDLFGVHYAPEMLQTKAKQKKKA